MSELTIHTLETAPQASRTLLKNAEKQIGFIPNLLAVMAESPALLEAYQSLNKLFEKTAFTVTEKQLVLLSISRYRNCSYCLAAHGTVAKMQKVPADIVFAVYYNQPIGDGKLEALRNFTRAILKADGWVNKKDLQNFYQAGYQQQHVLEVILAVSFKTLSNFTNQINDTLIDAQFLVGIPENNDDLEEAA